MIDKALALRTLAVTGVTFGMCAGGTVPALAAGSTVAKPVVSTANPSTVTVNGTGTASGTPDELSLTLQVDAQAASVNAALDTANQDMSRVRDALLANHVAAADMQTSGLSVQPQYNQQGKISGYSASESLTAELRDLAQAGKTIAAAVDAGGNDTRVYGLSFDLNDQSAKLMAKARASAIYDARTRATQYAAAAGRHLGRVLSITETGSSTPYAQAPGAMFAAGPAAVPLSPGTLQDTASVTVVYQLS
jgi:uncharacterized protein